MKFSQYLTEASGSVWVLFTDTQSGGADADDVIDNIEIFSVEKLMKAHEEIDIYHQVFMYKKVKID